MKELVERLNSETEMNEHDINGGKDSNSISQCIGMKRNLKKFDEFNLMATKSREEDRRDEHEREMQKEIETLKESAKNGDIIRKEFQKTLARVKELEKEKNE